MINFNVPPYVDSARQYMEQACEQNRKICGDGDFTLRVTSWLEKETGGSKVLLTTSCSHALDMMAIICNLGPGDEVILPSYNFVSGGNAIALRGAKCVFVDIRPDTMNIDEKLIEAAITEKTKAIMVMHYAGVACEMDTIMEIANKHNLLVLEDAAQAMCATYKGKPLGTIGDFGTYSFHETKNFTMGEGGCLIINNEKFIETAEIIREKGTDRSRFHRGQIDKYTWQEVGSSYLPSELNAAYLLSQLEVADSINKLRLLVWQQYYDALYPLQRMGKIILPQVPKECHHNGHMFYIKCENAKQRADFISYMKRNGVMCVFHYIPLHSSPAGMRVGEFVGEDKYTTKESECLVRLPLYYGIQSNDVNFIINCVTQYFEE